MDYIDRASGQCVEECQYFNQTLINGSVVVVCEQPGNKSNCPFWEYVEDIDVNMCVEECPAFSDSGLCVSSCPSFTDGSACVSFCSSQLSSGLQCVSSCPFAQTSSLS